MIILLDPEGDEIAIETSIIDMIEPTGTDRHCLLSLRIGEKVVYRSVKGTVREVLDKINDHKRKVDEEFDQKYRYAIASSNGESQ